MAKRVLTEKQQAFLNVLFEDAKGDFVEAKRLAGYSMNVSTKEIVDSLSDEIYELTKQYITNLGVKAAWSVSNIMEDPTQLGVKEKLAAAKDVLDRGNFKESQKVEISAENPLFILPAKD